jgi:RNA polymerase sigma-70 factor, ECF subfamily
MIPELATRPIVSSSDRDREQRLHSMVSDHFDAVWRGLRRLGVPAAHVDDAAQQVFLVASRRLDTIKSGYERRYLLGIALRIASEARRALRRRNEVPIDETIGLSASEGSRQPDQALDDKRMRALLSSILDGMPDELREAFVLFELEQFTGPEVAEMLGVPLGTVSSRVRRAREAVRRALAERPGER